MMSIYEENGYKNREEYLQSLSKDYGYSLNYVYELSSLLGPDEDFDGLIISLEDYNE